MSNEVKIDKFGFREYDARWVYEKDINNTTHFFAVFTTSWKPKRPKVYRYDR